MPTIDLNAVKGFGDTIAALEAIEPDGDVKAWLGHMLSVAQSDGRAAAIQGAIAEIQDQSQWVFVRRLVRRRAVRVLVLAVLFELTGVD